MTYDPQLTRGSIWQASLSGTFDWKANGDASQDPTSLILAYEKNSGDLGDATTMAVGSGIITISLTGDGAADREIYLVRRLDDLNLPGLRLATSVGLYVDVDFVSLGTVNSDTFSILLGNEDWASAVPTEWALCTMKYDAGNRKAQTSGMFNNASTTNTGANIANWANAGTMWVRGNGADVTGGFYEATGHTVSNGARVESDQGWVRAGAANTPYMVMRIVGRSGAGVVALTISSIKVVIS